MNKKVPLTQNEIMLLTFENLESLAVWRKNSLEEIKKEKQELMEACEITNNGVLDEEKREEIIFLCFGLLSKFLWRESLKDQIDAMKHENHEKKKELIDEYEKIDLVKLREEFDMKVQKNVTTA